MNVFFPVFLLLLLAAAPALAAPVMSCHCFQDRSFDPQRASAADPYFLATTQNSLLAASFKLSKKDVVRAKMSGTSGADLWISNFLAQRTGTNAEQWMSGRDRAGNWVKAVASGNLSTSVLGPRVAKAIKAGLSDEDLARAVVEETLERRAGIDPAVLAALSKGSASLQETVLAVFLEVQSGRPAVEHWEAVQSKNKTWGSLLNGYKIPPGEIEQRVVRMLHST